MPVHSLCPVHKAWIYPRGPIRGSFDTMPSSMSSSSSETEFRRPSVPDRAEVRWRSIENATKDKLYQLDLDPVSLPDSQKSFRTKFEDLWRTNSIPNVQTLLCRVDASFYQTAAFINAINGTTSKINGDGVASFLWGICFAIFHVCRCPPIQQRCACSRSQSVLLRGSSHKSVDQLVGDNGLVQIVVDLNNALAIVDVTLGVSGMYKFEDRLHGIYKKYVECCLGVIAICARRTDGKTWLPSNGLTANTHNSDCWYFGSGVAT
jgi:hypothetical protein